MRIPGDGYERDGIYFQMTVMSYSVPLAEDVYSLV